MNWCWCPFAPRAGVTLLAGVAALVLLVSFCQDRYDPLRFGDKLVRDLHRLARLCPVRVQHGEKLIAGWFDGWRVVHGHDASKATEILSRLFSPPILLSGFSPHNPPAPIRAGRYKRRTLEDAVVIVRIPRASERLGRKLRLVHRWRIPTPSPFR